MSLATVNVSSSGVNAVITAPAANQQIFIEDGSLIAAGAVDLTIEDSDGTDLFGPVSLAANGGSLIPSIEVPVGKGVSIRLGGAVQVGGSLTYRLGIATS